MILNKKTLEKLRDLINEQTEYRSGPMLVDFFNDLGFKDLYGQGFPSRWKYTDIKLEIINGTPELDKCIKKVFAPINFVGKIQELDNFIKDFNQYLSFDNWIVVRNGKNISFSKIDKIDCLETEPIYSIEDENIFVNKDFEDIDINSAGLDTAISNILKNRIEEIKKCIIAKAPLAVIFLSGSTLEGILLGIASNNPKIFNQSKASPKNKNNKVKLYQDWTLNDFINVAYEIGYIQEDVKKYSHSLRDFRNYIHPFAQMCNKFIPDEHTAKLCFQVLKVALIQISKKNNNAN